MPVRAEKPERSGVVHARLTRSLHDQVRDYAAERGLSINAAVIVLLEAGLAGERRRQRRQARA